MQHASLRSAAFFLDLMPSTRVNRTRASRPGGRVLMHNVGSSLVRNAALCRQPAPFQNGCVPCTLVPAIPTWRSMVPPRGYGWRSTCTVRRRKKGQAVGQRAAFLTNDEPSWCERTRPPGLRLLTRGTVRSRKNAHYAMMRVFTAKPLCYRSPGLANASSASVGLP